MCVRARMCVCVYVYVCVCVCVRVSDVCVGAFIYFTGFGYKLMCVYIYIYTGIFHLSMICLMVPLSFLGRYNYRRASDGVAVAGCKQPLLINDTVDVSLIEKGQISDDDINPIKENEASQDQAETFVTPLDTNSNVKS